MTPSERLALVWEVSRQAWAMKGIVLDQPIPARSLVRVVRPGAEGVSEAGE
jgi:hypothetical protein